jgi:hypothetical protein
VLDRLMSLPKISDTWDGPHVERVLRSELERL